MSRHPEHVPVMPNEVKASFEVMPDGTFVDVTLGMGGHSIRILREIPGIRRFVGIDRDTEILAIARERMQDIPVELFFVHGNFRDMKDLLPPGTEEDVAGILADLGISTLQLDTPERGFAFQSDAPIDMRMDRSQEKSAYHVINEYSEDQLSKILREWGEVRGARRIAQEIVRERGAEPIGTTGQFARTISKLVPDRFLNKELARIFQAIRIEVNDELSALEKWLEDAVSLLVPNGVITVLSYHSLEDRIVKNRFREWARGCVCPPRLPVCQCGLAPVLRLPKQKLQRPTEEEVRANGRARSARLRTAIRLAEAS
ncbi:MAG: 16S rRNA (cytosine(1402)-N(4))-methyltransferase RsmH [Gemmatimonadetes bacterium]|nr:16S rRNA (cytosine(1402)-N(4))-methyltransferase RsmH [Gemmatimonadota bacterium]